jgi:hypothetical protein
MQYRHISAARLAGRPPATFARHRPQLNRAPARMRAVLDGLRWRRSIADEPEVVTIAQLAECGCPDWCDLDHENA